MSVYEKVYNVVAENLQQAQIPFEYRKSTFLCDVEAHPQDVDVSRFLELPNEEFMEAVHVAVLKRLPDERQTDYWEQCYPLPGEQFQREVLNSLAHSSVVAINHIHLVNNPYFVQKEGVRYHMLGMLYGLTDKSSLREFGKKLPQPLQVIIRKVFL